MSNNNHVYDVINTLLSSINWDQQRAQTSCYEDEYLPYYLLLIVRTFLNIKRHSIWLWMSQQNEFTSVLHIFFTCCKTSYSASISRVALAGLVCCGMRTNSFIAEWGRDGERMQRRVFTPYPLFSPWSQDLILDSWRSVNWPVLGALKRTTKGSLVKASTSPGLLSGYWYWPVTATVSVLHTSHFYMTTWPQAVLSLSH